MNQHEFQKSAKQFRAGKISLSDFTKRVFSVETDSAPTVTKSVIGKLLDRLKNRQADSHKGDYGRLLVFAGSPGMSGAAALTGLAALRCGAGLVTVATDRRCQNNVATCHPSLMTVGLEIADATEPALSATVLHPLTRYDCLAIGPGLGTSEAAASWVHCLLAEASAPVVLDADGLNHLGNDFDFSTLPPASVLTPHGGEMSRLMGEAATDRSQQEAFASELASRSHGVVVLKGHRTLITDGQQTIYNTTGNPGMATAGSGDVLTGMIAALIGQGLSAWESAVLGCYLHGRAADIAAQQKSVVAMISTDIIDCLSKAINARSE